MDSKIKAVNDEPAANWIKTFENVITERNLDEIRKLIEKDAIIVEHRIYYGAQSPITKVFDDYDEINHPAARPTGYVVESGMGIS